MIRIYAMLITALLSAPCLAAGHGSQALQPNRSSSIGINLQDIASSSTLLPYLNLFKQAGGWTAVDNSFANTNEFSILYNSCLDANGYPVTLGTCPGGVTHTFTGVATTILNNMVTEPSGNSYHSGTYYLLYDGTCPTLPTSCFVYRKDAVLSTAIAGQDTLTVTASNNGFDIIMVATGTGANYIHNIRVVYCATVSPCPNQVLLASGENFNPDTIAYLKQFRSIRFMQPQGTLAGAAATTQVNWANRPPPNWAFWDEGSNQNPSPIFYGIPVEVMTALCNEVNADMWVSIPALANTGYVTSFADTVHLGNGSAPNAQLQAPLNANLFVYVQYANEVWNTGNAGYYAVLIGAAAAATFPSSPGLPGNSFPAFNAYATYQMVLDSQIWKTEWGADSGRVKAVFAGETPGYGFLGYNYVQMTLQAGMYGSSGSLFSGTAYQYFDYMAVAPYFPDDIIVPPAWTAATVVGLNGATLPGNGDGGYTALMLQQTQGGQYPSDVLGTGNCGNGAGHTCATLSMADSATLGAGGSGYSNGAQVLTATGGTCTTHPTFNVTVTGGIVQSGGISVANQGSCTAPPSNPTSTSGAGGSSATLNITYGALAYSFTSSSGSIPATPANGTQLVMHVDNNSETGGATMVVDGGTVYPLTNYVFNGVAAQEIGPGNGDLIFVFTNGVANFPPTGNTQSVTITCGNPTLVNWPGPVAGYNFKITFTGTVCTGMSTGTTYYILGGQCSGFYGQTQFQITTSSFSPFSACASPVTSSGSASGVSATVTPVPTWQYMPTGTSD